MARNMVRLRTSNLLDPGDLPLTSGPTWFHQGIPWFLPDWTIPSRSDRSEARVGGVGTDWVLAAGTTQPALRTWVLAMPASAMAKLELVGTVSHFWYLNVTL